jgi:hypothetical protein
MTSPAPEPEASNDQIMAELRWIRGVIERLLPLVDRYADNPAARWKARRRDAVHQDRA